MGFLDVLKLVGKLGKIIPGARKVGNPLVTQELDKAALYLFRGEISANQIAGGAVITGIVTFGVSFSILIYLFNILSSGILAFSLALITVLIILNSAVSKFESLIARIERVTPYALEELATIYLTTGSAFEAIFYVSHGSYDRISTALAQMIGPLNAGIPPEQLLTDYAMRQPSTTLKRGLLTFVNCIETNCIGLDTVIKDAHENLQRHFEHFTVQWESRMMVYAGILVFFPLIVVLGLAIRGLASNPIILLLPIIQYGLSNLLKRVLLSHDAILVGEEVRKNDNTREQ